MRPAKIPRRASPAAVARSLRELEILFRPPDKDTADPEGIPVSAADRESREREESTAPGGTSQPGRQ